ncbi:hypothetical protein SDC9_21654 [bioreactor metagenome]|uniref:Uncharacterized protein n=1 Tax=bioreactor metagenome TaxID=1076179 RepID=A0A644UAD6_9ZZZZ
MKLVLYFISQKQKSPHILTILGWDDYNDPQFFEFNQDYENVHLHELKDSPSKISKLFLTTSYTEALNLKQKLEADGFGGSKKLIIKKIVDD